MKKAIGAALAATLTLVIATAAGITGLFQQATRAGTPAPPSRAALDDIPPTYLALYHQAATECPGLPWTVLAAIGKVETDHGRHPTMVSTAGAIGPMQFLPSTFVRYDQPVPPGGSDPPTPWDPVNAIHAAARLLCAHGARHGADLERAIWHYNHADWYVDQVLDQADQYAARHEPSGTAPAPSRQAAIALAYARAQLGLPYQWGGNGPAAGDPGFDCSGLTQAAYAQAGIPLPRVAHDQHAHGPQLPPDTPLLAGDLVFYGTPDHIHHVGVYIGNGHMINAPNPDALIREEPYRYPGDDYLGATRPWASHPTGT
ncbi:bifunctional lytic transglycosylase/C40 family peptidase [Streptomyces sp. DSM 44915]|uniref:Bifunctional lytic transglycosylase/C40 family peptidase n=1 Tax=Streptomyces chisholmiae TaxID=3075540 RepID=A0ABU2JQG4_9ACTN|nr:bifunctional lytic transglycosylase/C40 family peptidase [Streptomyces sp. DSM 44915]MDT0267224.1 bifunctional lytic transglycosylase/C40 family peptidase [Streptomyces sp. DSM 44915]